MKPEEQSTRLLGITRSKAKMYEYGIPEKDHLRIPRGVNLSTLFSLTVGIIGDNATAAFSDSTDAARDQPNGNGSFDSTSVQFCTRYFDAFLDAKLNVSLHPYLLLVGAVAYYLNDRPGSSQVLAKRLGSESPALDSRNLDLLLHWLINDDWSHLPSSKNGRYGNRITGLSRALAQFVSSGEGLDDALRIASELRSEAYWFGTPRELLFADLIRAVVKKRLENSTWTCLPLYSGLDQLIWRPTLQKQGFMREMWPAQRLLGEKGVFAGKSAVVQFPTSAGKTHAVEIVLRSAFLSGRAAVAVVVAPFRALCHEISNRLIENFSGEAVIVNEVSDVFQMDILEELAEFLGVTHAQSKNILVVTPEKLLYLLRHSPQIIKHIGLLILDEGHHFDSGARGISYELLITALKQLLTPQVQIVLISAVIPNAEQISNWLIGKEAVTVRGSNLLPTERSIAFSSWTTQRGQLQFVEPLDTARVEFFVPRVLEELPLASRGRETKKRVFPEKTNSQAIALYLGLKLCKQGGVAVFCGRKDTIASLNDLLVEVFGRGLQLPKPSEVSNAQEVQRLHFLYKQHFGENESVTICAAWGIFSHHGNTPHGIRLAVEHAMKVGLAKYVICTSTLAQGVNLPIRYLIVTSVYQGADRIKVRDFQNLIGRTGRSGMHTEGTILFSDPSVYDGREKYRDQWRWRTVNELLLQDNLEPCNSSLLSILKPLESDGGQLQMTLSMRDLAELYVADLDTLTNDLQQFAREHANQAFSVEGLMEQLEWKITLLGAIESYLMAHRDPNSIEPFPEEARKLAQQTLAYFLGTPDQQIQLTEIFQILARHVETKVPDREKQQSYGRTLFGLNYALRLEQWVASQLSVLLTCDNEEALLECLWPLLQDSITYRPFRKCDNPDALKKLCFHWIAGFPFYKLFQELSESGARKIAGSQRRHFKLDDVVDLCENAFGYETTLIISGVADILERTPTEETASPALLFSSLQKRLRYGLPDRVSILLFEVGFADRVLAMDIRQYIGGDEISRRALHALIRESKDVFSSHLRRYPSYFQLVHDNLTS